MLLRTRIIAGVMASALTTAAIGGFAMMRTSAIGAETKMIATNWLPSVDMIATASAEVQVFRQSVMRHALVRTEADKREAERLAENVANRLNDLMARYPEMLTGQDEKAIFDTVRPA